MAVVHPSEAEQLRSSEAEAWKLLWSLGALGFQNSSYVKSPLSIVRHVSAKAQPESSDGSITCRVRTFSAP